MSKYECVVWAVCVCVVGLLLAAASGGCGERRSCLDNSSQDRSESNRVVQHQPQTEHYVKKVQ